MSEAKCGMQSRLIRSAKIARLRWQLQWDLIIKRSGYNKTILKEVHLQVPVLYISLGFFTLI